MEMVFGEAQTQPDWLIFQHKICGRWCIYEAGSQTLLIWSCGPHYFWNVTGSRQNLSIFLLKTAAFYSARKLEGWMNLTMALRMHSTHRSLCLSESLKPIYEENHHAPQSWSTPQKYPLPRHEMTVLYFSWPWWQISICILGTLSAYPKLISWAWS